jgi:hypothetical protein
MKHVDVEALVHSVPIQMTRKERLTRWAELVRKYQRELALYHGLEHMRPYDLRELRPIHIQATSAFTLAMADRSFNEQGLSPDGNIVDVMRFFELSQEELHEFACDCGGYIDNRRQAERIERLAG